LKGNSARNAAGRARIEATTTSGGAAVQVRQLTAVEQQMADDFAWARGAPEVQQNPEHFGKLIVIHDQRILGVGRDRQALVEQAAKEAGVPAHHLVVVLVPRPGLWEPPH
jgi:hypothetical protein